MKKIIKITIGVWFLVMLSVLANATTLSNTLSTFTGKVTIDQDDADTGLEIDHDGASGRALQITNANGEALKITQSGTGSAINVIRNVAGTDKLMLLRDSDASNTQPVLTVQQDGTGEQIRLPDAEQATCHATDSGIFANSTGVYACHNGNYYLLSQ